MNTEELSNRLTQIVQGITNTHPIRIKATIEVFLEEFDPSQNYLPRLIYLTQGLTKVPGFLLTLT